VSVASTGVAGHVFNTPSHATSEALIPPFSHFDPFGTEFREPGRVSHPGTFPIDDCPLPIERNYLWFSSNRQLAISYWQLQRSFQLSSKLLTSARQSRLNSTYADIKRNCNFLISKTFNVT
jgi:hypothetical protein